MPHGCESFSLWHSRTHIPATTRNFCALPFIFVIVNIGADFLLVLNLVALHCKWHANETSPKLYPLTKGELSMFYFLDSFFVCVCYSLSLSFVSGTSLLECVYFIHSLIYIRLHPFYFVHAENVIHHLHHLIEANPLENATQEMTNCRTYHE